jgi:hypothetical protein
MESDPAAENIEARIEALRERLKGLDEQGNLFDRVGENVQEEWYYVAMEARMGEDREAAAVHLEAFLKTLEKLKGEIG